MRTINTFVLLFLTLTCAAQTTNFRKAILKSDLIVVSNTFTTDTVRTNDYTSAIFVKLNQVDHVLKNKFTTIPKNLKVRKYQDNEDFYSELITNGGGCIKNAYMLLDYLESTKYNTLFFIRKKGKEYEAFLVLENTMPEEYGKITDQISTITAIELLKNDKERFEKSVDWFIENGLMPDEDFITYYKQKGIIKDNIQYSDQQYSKALHVFLNGNEELLPLVRDKYFSTIQAASIQKMKDILDKVEELDNLDYSAFRNEVDNVTNNFNSEYYSGDYILNENLEYDKFTRYEKQHIMEHLLKVVSEWK